MTPGPRLGLRARSALALALACLVALVPAGLLGWRALDTIQTRFGEDFAEHYARLNRERILAPVSRDLALSIRLAESEFLRQWLLDEEDRTKRAACFQEAEGYRQAFRDGAYFLISALTDRYYFNDGTQAFSDRARYTLDPAAPSDAWFFNILKQDAPYNINVNPDIQLGTTRVWLNVPVTDEQGRRIGLAGTGLDLSGFLREFIQTHPAGVTPMILDRGGAIQAHPDPRHISFGSTALGTVPRRTLAELVADDAQRRALGAALAAAAAVPDQVSLLPVTLERRPQLLALAYMPELHWYLAAAVDLRVASRIDPAWLWGGLLALALLLLALLAGFAFAVDRIVLRPLRVLRRSALALSAGQYDLPPPTGSRDEIGDLGRAFAGMASQVKQHTEELEARVRARTASLEEANRAMALTQRQLRHSLDYASLIQRAMLPPAGPAGQDGLEQAALWRPRDVVGGDFHLARGTGAQRLLGVIDCAGHGVPGALMTMLAHAALEQAFAQHGLDAPAALLNRVDDLLRTMLHEAAAIRTVATHLDAALVHVDLERGILRYAGARIDLYRSDGDRVERIPGARRALGERRPIQYRDRDLVLDPAMTYYLTTDGYLDQAGGPAGFGMGRTRFMDLIRSRAPRPLADQMTALEQALDDYRGARAQLDDITMLAFRAAAVPMTP